MTELERFKKASLGDYITPTLGAVPVLGPGLAGISEGVDHGEVGAAARSGLTTLLGQAGVGLAGGLAGHYLGGRYLGNKFREGRKFTPFPEFKDFHFRTTPEAEEFAKRVGGSIGAALGGTAGTVIGGGLGAHLGRDQTKANHARKELAQMNNPHEYLQEKSKELDKLASMLKQIQSPVSNELRCGPDVSFDFGKQAALEKYAIDAKSWMAGLRGLQGAPRMQYIQQGLNHPETLQALKAADPSGKGLQQLWGMVNSRANAGLENGAHVRAQSAPVGQRVLSSHESLAPHRDPRVFTQPYVVRGGSGPDVIPREAPVQAPARPTRPFTMNDLSNAYQAGGVKPGVTSALNRVKKSSDEGRPSSAAPWVTGVGSAVSSPLLASMLGGGVAAYEAPEGERLNHGLRATGGGLVGGGVGAIGGGILGGLTAGLSGMKPETAEALIRALAMGGAAFGGYKGTQFGQDIARSKEDPKLS